VSVRKVQLKVEAAERLGATTVPNRAPLDLNLNLSLAFEEGGRHGEGEI
jgi:hypothetical protein